MFTEPLTPAPEQFADHRRNSIRRSREYRQLLSHWLWNSAKIIVTDVGDYRNGRPKHDGECGDGEQARVLGNDLHTCILTRIMTIG